MTHIHLNPDKAQESVSGDATKKNDEVKKSLSERQEIFLSIGCHYRL